jgi:hypothetical protein
MRSAELDRQVRIARELNCRRQEMAFVTTAFLSCTWSFAAPLLSERLATLAMTDENRRATGGKQPARRTIRRREAC